MLRLIPLTVVETRREVDELKELLTIARCAWVCLIFDQRMVAAYLESAAA